MSQQQQQQYRDPPPYPGHSKQIFSNQPGLRQSFSGSETSTDVSLSSTENLATWQRQEPQGEETQAPLYQPLDDGSYSILARLGMPPSAIESKGSVEMVSSSPPSIYTAGSLSYSSYSTHSQSIYATSSSSGREELTNVYSASGGGQHSLAVPQHHWQTHGLPPPQSGQYSRARSLTPTYHHPHPYVNQHWTPGEEGGHATQNPPLSYLTALPPPPQYPGSKAPEVDKDVLRSYEKLGGKTELGHSQPELIGLTGSGDSQVSAQDKTGGQLGSHASSEPVFSILHSGVQVRKKDAQMGRLEKLQKAFSSLQMTSERREEMEKQLRTRLERELETYRSESQGSRSGTSTPKEEAKSVTALKQILNEKETKILQLETEIVRWEQRYVELQAVQQMEESSGPQHAHLAALEKSSAETEKLIDEAKTEKLRHMEELYQSNRRVAELEAKVKWLQTQLTEKEAMVKVYQRAPPSLPRSSSVHAICCSPHHSPRPSLIASTAYTRPSGPVSSSSVATGSYCDFVSIRHVKTGSTSAIETGRKMSMDDTLTSQDTFHHGSKSDSEDETRLWQV